MTTLQTRPIATTSPDTTSEAVRMSACAKEPNRQTGVIHIKAS
jgi:hypothetical protein